MHTGGNLVNAYTWGLGLYIQEGNGSIHSGVDWVYTYRRGLGLYRYLDRHGMLVSKAV